MDQQKITLNGYLYSSLKSYASKIH